MSRRRVGPLIARSRAVAEPGAARRVRADWAVVCREWRATDGHAPAFSGPRRGRRRHSVGAAAKASSAARGVVAIVDSEDA